MPVIQRVRIANPAGLLTILSNGKRRRVAAKTRKARNYSGAQVRAHQRKSQGWKGGVSNMAKQAKKQRNYKRRSNPHVVGKAKRRSYSHRNPHLGFAGHKRRSYRRNPEFAGFTFTSAAKVVGGGLAGGLATRGLTQLVLKDKNTGGMGILANVGVAGLLTYLASKIDTSVAAGVLAGGGAVTLQRVWDVYVSKVLADGTVNPPAIAAAAQTAPDGTPKLGDVSFSGNGLGYYSGADWPAPHIKAILPGAGTPMPPDVVDQAFKPAFAA
jgi:hypothetical protein